ncbi:single-stranded-DNA-specific exonuclease RecJ, partial [Patescibacteria group bacterium]
MADLYQWRQEEKAADEVANRFPELDPVAVQLLLNRGIETQEEVDRFLTPDYGQDQHDPYLFRDMEKAVARIEQAVNNKEKIVIHGDYDADGVCGSALLYKVLKQVGGEVDVYLPHRDTEGYGLNMNTVQSLADVGTDLMITVDCGISNKPEIHKASELGIDVIVTDHHSQPPEMPEKVVAIINPKVEADKYPFKHLAGVGVAFKLSQALIKKFNLGEAYEKWLLDLVAISTVTDHVKLTGENRVFLKYGLIVLQKNMRLGLRKLNEVIGVNAKEIDTTTIGFKIGPHINAAGRVDHANMAFEMIIEEDEEKAAQMAADLGKTNKERQKISERLAREALAQAKEQKDEFIIIVDGDDWPVGMVGLVAGKVSSEFNRPAFIISRMGDEVIGSGRSIEHFDIVEALQSMDELFSKYGGHPMA